MPRKFDKFNTNMTKEIAINFTHKHVLHNSRIESPILLAPDLIVSIITSRQKKLLHLEVGNAHN